MKKKLFYILVVLVALLCPQILWAQENKTCDNARELKNREVTISIADKGDYWFLASTFDLPIHVHFVPKEKNLTVAPIAYVDFSCTTGDYSFDQKLDSVIKYGKEMDKNLPYELPATAHRDDELGQIVYDLNVGRKYRDQLSSMGITYEVTAYVKVHVECGGGVTIAPDTVGVKCKESCAWINKPDTTIEVVADDEETAYVLPLADWQNDSVQFIWTGVNKPVSIWFGSDDCAFEPKANGKYVLSDRHYVIEPNSELKLTTDSINRLVNTILARGGVYYVKFVSSESAGLIIQRVPEKGADGDAKLLKYTQVESLTPEKDELYYYFKSWKATRFETNTSAEVTMYVGATAELNAEDASTQIAAFAMSLGEDGNRYLALSDADMKVLSDKAAKGSNGLYVRFRTAENVKVTPQKWDASACEDKTYLLQEGVPVTINGNDNGKTMYRMRFSEWEGYKMVIKRTDNNAAKLTVYFGDTCKYTQGKNSNTMHDDNSMNARVYELDKSGTKNLKSSDLNKWKASLKDGYFYVTFKCSQKTTVTFTREEQPITKITLSTVEGGTTLNVDTTSLTIVATISPAGLDNKPLKWEMVNAQGLVEWNEQTRTLRAISDNKSGFLTVQAKAMDGSNVASDVMIINVKARPIIYVDTLVLSTDINTLTADAPTAHLSLKVLPENADDKTVEWKIEGEELADFNEEDTTVTMHTNTAGGLVRIQAVAKDGHEVKSNVVVLSVGNTKRSEKVTISGPTSLTSQQLTATYSAKVEPEAAVDTTVTWSILSGDTLVTMEVLNGGCVLTLIKNLNGGEVKLAATANDGTGVADTLTIQVEAVSIPVESLLLSTKEGVLRLTENQPSLHLVAKVLPENAKDKSVVWSIDSIDNTDAGMKLVTLKDNVVSLNPGFLSGSVVVRATAQDGSNVSETLVLTTASVSGDTLLRIMLETYEQIENDGQNPVLDDDTLHVRVVYVPENPSSRDIRLEVREGGKLIQPIRDYEMGKGFVIVRSSIGEAGEVELLATSYGKEKYKAKLRLTVKGTQTEDVKITTADAPRYRKVLRDGMLYIEVLTDKGTMVYNVLGYKE